MRSLRYLQLAAVAILGACGSDSTGPTLDVTSLVDQMSSGSIATYSAISLSASVPGVSAAVAIPSSSASSCAYSVSNQRFECAPVAMNGLTITRSYALLDASGRPMSVPNPLAVASIRTITDVKGTLAGASTFSNASSMTVDRHEDATMSGLQTAAHVLNGTSTQKLDFVITEMPYSSSETSATTNLQLPSPSAASHWPLGGIITTDRTVTIAGVAASMTSHEVLSFDGTSVMTLTRTSGGVTMTCKFDLAKPATPPVCS